MKTRKVQKRISLLLMLCMALGLCAGALAEAAPAAPAVADFDALLPVLDTICSASMYANDEPESIPGAEGVLTVMFTDTFFKVAYKNAALGVTDATLTDTNAQAALLSQVFAAQLPQLEPVTVTEGINGYIGFHPVTVNAAPDGAGVQLIGEMYLADKPLSQMSQLEYGHVEWLDRAVFTLKSDANALNGFRVEGFSVGTDLAVESAIQGYFEDIVVEYVNSNLGFSLLYPAVFTDDLLQEDADGVSAILPDESVSFFAKRTENMNGATLSDYVEIVSNGITDSVANVNDELHCGTVFYTTEEGYAVFEVYILTEQYIYQAQLRYLTSLMSEYSMFNAYMENSFVANELSVG